MLGSSISVAGPNIVLNTAVAEALRQFYEELKDTPSDQMEEAVHGLVKRAISIIKNNFQRQRLYGGMGKRSCRTRAL